MLGELLTEARIICDNDLSRFTLKLRPASAAPSFTFKALWASRILEPGSRLVGDCRERLMKVEIIRKWLPYLVPFGLALCSNRVFTLSRPLPPSALWMIFALGARSIQKNLVEGESVVVGFNHCDSQSTACFALAVMGRNLKPSGLLLSNQNILRLSEKKMQLFSQPY